MKAAQGSGIISSFFFYTGTPHDEIDVEFLGKDTTKVQFNYLKNGVGGHEQLISLGFDAASALLTSPTYVYLNIWNGTGIDAYLGPFNYTVPLEASYDWVKVFR
jgi:beta-glucanase (GH16 family)